MPKKELTRQWQIKLTEACNHSLTIFKNGNFSITFAEDFIWELTQINKTPDNNE